MQQHAAAAAAAAAAAVAEEPPSKADPRGAGQGQGDCPPLLSTGTGAYVDGTVSTDQSRRTHVLPPTPGPRDDAADYNRDED
jgi:hypothetical protein